MRDRLHDREPTKNPAARNRAKRRGRNREEANVILLGQSNRPGITCYAMTPHERTDVAPLLIQFS